MVCHVGTIRSTLRLSQKSEVEGDLRECTIVRGRLSSAASRSAAADLTYRLDNFFNERTQSPALKNAVFLGTVTPELGAQSMQCARMVQQRAQEENQADEAARMALFQGNQCYFIPKKQYDEVKKYGPAPTITVRPGSFDRHGANLGTRDVFAVYTVEPTGMEGRYIRLLRRTGPAARIQVYGVTAYGPRWTVLPVRDVRVVRLSTGDNQPSAAVDVVPGAYDTLDAYRDDLLLRRGNVGELPRFLSVGPDMDHAVLYDLGAKTRVHALGLRNHGKQGDPTVEAQIKGCALQLLDENFNVVIEKAINHGALQYQWELR